MNIKEIEESKKVNTNEWQKIGKDYDILITNIRILNTKVIIVIFCVAIIAFFYFFKLDWAKIISAIIALYCLVELAKREGHKEGYVEGYEAGRDAGINKTLGIDEEDAVFIDEVLSQPEINKK